MTNKQFLRGNFNSSFNIRSGGYENLSDTERLALTNEHKGYTG